MTKTTLALTGIALLAYPLAVLCDLAIERSDCAAAGYFHRQSTVYLCRGEAYWGRVP